MRKLWEVSALSTAMHGSLQTVKNIWTAFVRNCHILSMFGDRIGKLLLKQAVEQNVCNHILASDTDIDAQTYQQMRGKSYQEVLRTNGQISFPEVLRQHSRL